MILHGKTNKGGEIMANILKLLKGKRTYLVAIAMGVGVVLNLLGIIDADTLKKIELFLAPLGLAALRSGVNSNIKPK